MSSIWTQTVKPPSFPPLERDLNTDALIVGGGIAGLLCARFLRQAGVDCVLLEAGEICGGVTGNTTAKITVQHGLVYDKLLRTFGAEMTRLYLEANLAALDQYRTLCRDIDCDFEEQDAYVYSLNRRDKLEHEVKALNRIGFRAEYVPEPALPMRTAGAVRFRKQAQFHPLKFLFAIAKDLPVHEHTKVLELKPGAAKTHQGIVRAKHIIIATHFPVLNKHGGYFLKLYQSRSYVLPLENAPKMDGMYISEAEKGLSFRPCGNLLLLGGGSHRTGKQGGGWAELSAFAQRTWPQAREVCRWAAQDCISLDSVPYIGQYSARTPGLYAVTGFNKWGMTSAMAAAMVLCDLVQGRNSPYATLFSPSRSILHPQLAANAVEAAVSLLTPTVPRCPHMGCALKYNPQEHSWDCPCHGSRFGEDGQLMDNPSTDDLQRRPRIQ